MKIEEFLSQYYNYSKDIRGEAQSYIDLWKQIYKGKITGFHDYLTWNGIKNIKQTRYTMNLAKVISEDWSDILWSEKCKISMKDETNQDQFDELLDKLDLNTTINQLIEKSGALGTCGAVVSVYDIISNQDKMTLDVSNAKTRVDIVDVDWIYPITWNNKEITECAFGSVEYLNGVKHIVLSVHKIGDDGNYHIYNHLFRATNENITEIPSEDGTVSDFNTGSNVKWFSIFKPLLTNNLFDNSPFGIPHYANAIDNIKAVDICYDAIKNEVKFGKRRTFVRADMLNYNNGEQTPTFNSEDDDLYVLPKGATAQDLIQHDNEDLRTDKQISALNTNLNILGDKVGFGTNHFTYDGVNLQTATAVVSSNSKLFRRKKKLEIGYESSIFDLVKSVCYASSEFGQYNIDTEDMVITFDDSIIEDHEAESNRALREVSAGVMSKEEYREKIFSETPEIAEEKIRLIQENEPSVADLIGE